MQTIILVDIPLARNKPMNKKFANIVRPELAQEEQLCRGAFFNKLTASSIGDGYAAAILA